MYCFSKSAADFRRPWIVRPGTEKGLPMKRGRSLPGTRAVKSMRRYPGPAPGHCPETAAEPPRSGEGRPPDFRRSQAKNVPGGGASASGHLCPRRTSGTGAASASGQRHRHIADADSGRLLQRHRHLPGVAADPAALVGLALPGAVGAAALRSPSRPAGRAPHRARGWPPHTGRRRSAPCRCWSPGACHRPPRPCRPPLPPAAPPAPARRRRTARSSQA